MKKLLRTTKGQILYSAFIFSLSVALLHYSPLSNVHGRSDAAIIVAIFGVLSLVISYLLNLKVLTLTATFGYILALIIAFLFQSNGVDPAGGTTNNLWQIWLVSYWIMLAAGLIADIFIKRKK